VAARELGHFTGLTLLLPFRRNPPCTPNFTLRLRLRVLTEVTLRLPTTLLARHQITCHQITRTTLWSTWAGRP
jgi:hypothetical protein